MEQWGEEHFDDSYAAELEMLNSDTYSSFSSFSSSDRANQSKKRRQPPGDSVDKANKVHKENSSGNSVVQPVDVHDSQDKIEENLLIGFIRNFCCRPELSAAVGSSQQESSEPLALGEGLSYSHVKARQQKYMECAVHAIEKYVYTIEPRLRELKANIAAAKKAGEWKQ